MTSTHSSTAGRIVLADLVPGSRSRDVVLVLAGTAFITAGGFILIPLPFTPVPISLATFAVLVTGAALGPVRGASSAGLYLALGSIGLPIFGDGRSGWAFASFGYIIGYVLAALIAGQLARRRADRSPVSTFGMAVTATAAIYVCGVPWLCAHLGIDVVTAVSLGVLPFLIGDALKLVAIAAILPSTWRVLDGSEQ